METKRFRKRKATDQTDKIDGRREMMHKTKIYRAYGLIIESEIELPELIEDQGDPDVTVRIGTVPELSEANTGRYKRIRATKDELLLTVEEVAQYYVENGKSIVVRPIQPIDESAIRLFLLGSAFGALLQQRGYYVLHGSAVESKGKAYVFSGKSGAGKSTLTATLAMKGYPLIADDVCAIDVRTGVEPTILPGFPRIKLCKDAAELLDKDCSKGLPVRAGFEKYNFPVDDMRQSQALPIGGIFIIRKGEREGLCVEPVTGLRKIRVLVRNTYRWRFVKIRREEQRLLDQCANLAAKVNIHNLLRGGAGSSAQEISSFLIQNGWLD